MTKTLTEQWRDGTLKTGSYYIRIITGNEKSDYFEGKKFCFWNDYEVEEVLAPVPSYNEYLYLKTNNDHWNKEAIRISKQASCIVLERDELVQKMHILEKKLAIAMEALDAVSGDYNEAENLGYYFMKIKEVK